MTLVASRALAQAPDQSSAAPPPDSPVPPQPKAEVPTPVPKGATDSSNEQRLAAAAVCAAHQPSCDWVRTFSLLEQQSVVRGLAERGLTIDAAPWGKQIAVVQVYNEDVFAEDNWLQFFNVFHYTTRERAITDELTIHAGDVWRDELVEESARRLHDPLYSSVVALVPVTSNVPGKVDLLVVTRDVWSLRFNTQYAFQQSSLTNLSISISENNFLGHRDLLAAAVIMDQAAIAVGPLFIDKNVLGTHLNFQIRVDEILTRRAPLVFDPGTASFVPVPGDPAGLQDGGTLHSEGRDGTVSLVYPLWSLATEWGGGISASFRDAVIRAFSGAPPASDPNVSNPNALYLDPGTMLPYEYRLNSRTANPYVVRQWGHAYKQQFTFGYILSSQRPSVLPSFQGDPVAFAADVFPHSEVISQPYIDFAVFQPRYRTIRNVTTYDLAEDLRIGPDFDVGVGQGLRLIGSDHTFERPTMNVGWTFPWCRDGFVRSSASASLRIQQDSTPHGWATIDNSAGFQLRAATPQWPHVRVVGQLGVDIRWHDTQNALFATGSDLGLRGYFVDQFRLRGDGNRVALEVEARSTPVPWWVFRVGAVVFYEAAKLTGAQPGSPVDTTLYQDVGFGVRALIPQTSRDLLRFDIGFPLVAAPGRPVGAPQLIAGFASYF